RRPEGAMAAAAHSRALFAAMRLTADSGRLAYTELPAGWLSLPHLPTEIGKGCLLALPDSDVVAPLDAAALAQIKALRLAGARVGWAGAATQASPPDFAVVHPIGDNLSSLRSRGLPLLARDVDDIELLEAALRAGVELACCSIVQHSEPKDAQPIAPQMPRLCHLLNRLVQGAETGPVVADIKADVGLAYRLLHHFNNVGVGGGRSIESIEQAVLLLGRNELYRWLSVLLIRFAAERPAATALKEIALARARLFELLAIDAKEPAPGSLFTLGLASMLGLLMNVKLADAVEPLNLPEAAREALLFGRGPWMAYLALATALEQGGAQTETLALPFGGLARVIERSAEAWAWSQDAGDDPV
ncbi:MAG: HDOD domain-containing protein, partial [Pseudomonadota bacterium]|nr:HDOD domain-containing protein [Pseudomonadota bacterium]